MKIIPTRLYPRGWGGFHVGSETGLNCAAKKNDVYLFNKKLLHQILKVSWTRRFWTTNYKRAIYFGNGEERALPKSAKLSEAGWPFRNLLKSESPGWGVRVSYIYKNSPILFQIVFHEFRSSHFRNFFLLWKAN